MAQNPYDAPTTNDESKEEKRKNISFVELVVICFIILLLVGLLLPAVRAARDRPPKCLNHLKMISLALWNYEHNYGSYPPPFTVDSEGNRLHSWRTLLLPYMEAADVYQEVDFDQPWDAPENAKARLMVESKPYFRCVKSMASTKTNYLSMVGLDCFFHPSRCRTEEELSELAIGLIAIIEVPDELAVHWMEPKDLTDFGPLNFQKAKLLHRQQVYVARAEGTCQILAVNEFEQTLEVK
jgi:Protein of unknown function (DUF1559)